MAISLHSLLAIFLWISLILFLIFGVFEYNYYYNPPAVITNYDNFQVLRLSPYDVGQVAALRYLQLTSNVVTEVRAFLSIFNLDFWTDANAVNTTIDVMVPPSSLNSFASFLTRKNISYEIFLDDVQRVIEKEDEMQAQTSGEELRDYRSISWKRYHRLTEIHRFLNWLAIAHPTFVRVLTIGRSSEGRALRVIKIGRPLWGASKPAIWIEAGVHAREWIAPATATYIIDQLVNNYTGNRKLVDKVDWYILPVTNPDGYEFSHTHLRLWRKTRSSSRRGGACIGADANRNYGFFWNRAGTSPNPCSQVYPGARPFSEPETSAISSFILKHKNIKLHLTLHSYKQLLMMPWGHTKVKPNDYNEMKELGTEAVDALKSVFGTTYDIGSSFRLLYTTSGGSTDWAKGVAGIKYTYTLELRDGGHYGFLLPATEILPTAIETMEAVKVFGNKVITLAESNNLFPDGYE